MYMGEDNLLFDTADVVPFDMSFQKKKNCPSFSMWYFSSYLNNKSKQSIWSLLVCYFIIWMLWMFHSSMFVAFHSIFVRFNIAHIFISVFFFLSVVHIRVQTHDVNSIRLKTESHWHLPRPRKSEDEYYKYNDQKEYKKSKIFIGKWQIELMWKTENGNQIKAN